MTRSGAAALDLAHLRWLAEDQRPLDWNGPTDRAFECLSEADLNRPIIDHVARAARRYPDRLAVTDGNASLSNAELWDAVSGLAETLAAKPDGAVAISVDAPLMFPIAALACIAAARPFVALDPHYPRPWLEGALREARPALIIAGETFPADAGAAPVINLVHPPRRATEAWRQSAFDVDAPACVLFTSGSTGKPKGVVNSQRNLLQRALQSINAAHINADDKLLTLASPYTIVGVRDLVTGLIAGASIRLLDPQRTGAREILSIVRDERVSILFALPALLRSLLSFNEKAGDALRIVRIGGDTILWSDIDLVRPWLKPSAAIQVIFAATEAPMMQWFVDDALRGDDPRVPIGYPLPGNLLAIVDDHDRPASPGEVGELIVASPYVALGLWIDGRCSAQSASCAGARIFRTGDLVRQRSDGLLERVGRHDRQIKVRGLPVDLDGVEARLRQHPRVRDAGALGRVNGADGTATLVAYVHARDGAPGSLQDDLTEWMRTAPAHMRPQRFYLVGEIPRLPSSKLDVRALVKLDEINLAREHPAAASEAWRVNGDFIAQTTAQVWQSTLHAPPRSPQEDFFDVGGDSLKAMTFMLELERALGVELPVTLINEAPTFGGLCEALRNEQTRTYAPLVLLKPGDASPPVFIVHGVGGNVAELLPMARRMAYPGAVYGIKARGLYGPDPPHKSVEDMALAYLAAIRTRQPDGPYHLCGYSFGGLVAFEMARRLHDVGSEVGLVGLFDTMMSPARWSLRAWLSIISRRIMSFPARVTDWLRGAPQRTRRSPGFLKAAKGRVLKVAGSALIASARYRPGFYPGELTLFTPAAREPGLPSLQSIWGKHARALALVETPGVHATMLAPPNADATAELLTRRLA